MSRMKQNPRAQERVVAATLDGITPHVSPFARVFQVVAEAAARVEVEVVITEVINMGRHLHPARTQPHMSVCDARGHLHTSHSHN